MVRLRAGLHAVPSRVWASVAGLAVLASLSVAVVLGAGLQVWRGAVGSPTAAAPAGLSQLPRSGLVTVPGGPARGAAKAPARPGPPATAPVAPPAAATPARQAAPQAVAEPSPAAPRTSAPVPPSRPAVSLPVVPLDALLANLHGPERKMSVTALSTLALQPAVAWSVNGVVEGEGPDALIRAVQPHASRGVLLALQARLRAAAALPARSTPDLAAKHGGRHRTHGHANRHEHHQH